MCPSATTSEVGGALNGSVRMKLFATSSNGTPSPESSPPTHATAGTPPASPSELTPSRMTPQRVSIPAGDVSPPASVASSGNSSAHDAQRAIRALNLNGTTPDAGAGRRRFSLGRRSMPHSGSAPDIASMDDASSSADSVVSPPRLQNGRSAPLFPEKKLSSRFFSPRAPAAAPDPGASTSSPRQNGSRPIVGARRNSVPFLQALPQEKDADFVQFVDYPLTEMGQVEDREDGEATLARAGWLLKCTKGGFTKNWNQRFFALIGSTIYYGTSPIDLSIQPKLFAHMHDVVNLSYPPRQCALAPHPHTFALEVMGTPRTRSRSVVTGTDARGKPSGMLLLSADSAEEMKAWLTALALHRSAPPCAPAAVAQRLALHQAHIQHFSYQPTGKRDRTLITDLMLADADARRPPHEWSHDGATLDVDSVPEETRTPVEWLLAAVRKCTRSMDLARCLEKNVIGDGTPLGII